MDTLAIYTIYKIVKQQLEKKKEQEEPAQSSQSPYSFEHLFQFGSIETAEAETVEGTQGKYQAELCGLMSMYQAYHTLLWLKQEENYALRGSVIKCSYGTKHARLDCLRDHGVIMGNLPVMTCTDCRSTNIHNFGSCMCPESRYRGRLPMTASVHPNGQPAKKLPANEFAHICVPMIKGRWLQTEGNIEIVDKKEVAHALVKEASLTCQYGGRIRIVETNTGELSFEEGLRRKGFPEEYLPYLLKLHQEYPNWEFEAVLTHVDYQEFLQYQLDDETKCAHRQEYPAYCSDKLFVIEKSGAYNVANKDAVKFFSHPYGLLNRNGKYENAMQFLNLDQELPEEYATEALSLLLEGMSQENIEAIKNFKGCTNPVFLAAIHCAEQGPVGELYKGKEVYNLFNIGGDGGRDDSLDYAYENEWFTIEKCLNESDSVFKEYIQRGQNTLYALDWDYVGYETGVKTGSVSLHQYATLVNDAEDKGLFLQKRNGTFYLENHKEIKLFFSIPVFENLPNELLIDPNHK